MERKLYKLVKKLAILYYRFLCLVLPVNQRVTPAIQSTSTNIWWPMAMISSGTVSGFMKKTNTIYPA